MIKNYFKVAWRNLWRNKIFSIIKILGLSIGLTVCMLIFLYTKDEISYDQFHKNKAQLYRIIQTMADGDKTHPQTIGITNGIMGETFAKEIPEVQQYVRINGECGNCKERIMMYLLKIHCLLMIIFFRYLHFRCWKEIKELH